MPIKAGLNHLPIIRYWIRKDVNAAEAVLTRIVGPARDLLWESTEVLPAYLCRLARRALFLLNCLMRVARTPEIQSTVFLSSKEFRRLQCLFYGALYSQRFNAYELSVRRELAKAFQAVLLAAQVSVVPIDWPRKGTPPQSWIGTFEAMWLDEAEVAELRGFWLRDRSGGELRIQLDGISRRLGVEFRDTLHEALRAIAQTRATSPLLESFVTALNVFIGQYPGAVSAEHLQQPSFTREFFRKMMDFHFHTIEQVPFEDRVGKLQSLQWRWTDSVKWVSLLAQHGVWVIPRAFPRGKPSLATLRTIRHHRVRHAHGHQEMYTQKLVTSVPLHLSDTEAYTILFHRIERDFAHVREFTRQRIDSIVADCRAGRELEDTADPRVDESPTPSLFRESHAHALANTIRAIRGWYAGYVDTTRTKTPFRRSKRSVARLMGFLNLEGCLMFAAHLMAIAPQLTETALLTAQAFDRYGNRIGVTHTDAGCYLSVRKDRARQYQTILLSGQAAQVVSTLF